MAKMRLDVEEWQALFEAATSIPEEDRRPCLQSAMLGIGILLHMQQKEDPHDCDAAECEKALESAAAHIQAGRDPYQIDLQEDPTPKGTVLERLTALETAVEELTRAESE